MKIKGSWKLDEIKEFLNDSTIPIRLSLIDNKGFPIVVSLWFIFINNKFWCAVQSDSKVAKMLKKSNNCGFEISNNSPPYMGVRGKGRVNIYNKKGKEVLKVLIKRYLTDSNNKLKKWLIKRSENEIAISIDPISLYSWDYSHRMKADSQSTEDKIISQEHYNS